MRISSPPTTHSCFYGIDTPERGKLLAAQHDVEEMARASSASTAWPSSRSTGSIARWASRAAIRRAPHFCDACFTGDYPIALPDAGGQFRPAAVACWPRRRLMPKPLAGRRRAGHRRARGIGAATAVALARLGAHVRAHRPHPGRPGGDRRRDPRASAAARRCCRSTWRRTARSRHAIGPSHRSSASAGSTSWCTLPACSGEADAGRAYPAATTGQDVVAVNLTACLAPDPHLRPAAARRRSRPRGVRHRCAGARSRRPIGAPMARPRPGMEHLVLTWAAEVRTTPLRVNLFDPGAVATRLRGRRCPARTRPRCRSPAMSRRRSPRYACPPKRATGWWCGMRAGPACATAPRTPEPAPCWTHGRPIGSAAMR